MFWRFPLCFFIFLYYHFGSTVVDTLVEVGSLSGIITLASGLMDVWWTWLIVGRLWGKIWMSLIFCNLKFENMLIRVCFLITLEYFVSCCGPYIRGFSVSFGPEAWSLFPDAGPYRSKMWWKGTLVSQIQWSKTHVLFVQAAGAICGVVWRSEQGS